MTTRITGCDYSFSRPKVSVLQAGGLHFAGRYYSTPGNPKNLDASEAVRLLSHGIDIVTVYETTANWMRGGYQAGAGAARSAEMQAKAAGQPAGSPIFYAADFDADSSARQRITQCLNGVYAYSGRYKVGVYGSYDVCADAVRQHPDIYTWQTLAWSGGRILAYVDIYQNGDTLPGYPDVDIDIAYTAEYGGWRHWAQQPSLSREEDVTVYVQVVSGQVVSIPVPAGKYSGIMVGSDSIGEPHPLVNVRVASHSQGRGVFDVHIIPVSGTSPMEYTFPDGDVDMVTIKADVASTQNPMGAYLLPR